MHSFHTIRANYAEEPAKFDFLFWYTCFAYQGLKPPNFNFVFWSPCGIEPMYTNHTAGNRVICGFGLLVFCKWQEHFYMFLHFTVREHCTVPDNDFKAPSRHKAHLAEDFHPAIQLFAHSLRNSCPSPLKCFLNPIKHANGWTFFFFCNTLFKHNCLSKILLRSV